MASQYRTTPMSDDTAHCATGAREGSRAATGAAKRSSEARAQEENMGSTTNRDWTKAGRVLRRIGANLAALAVGGVAARATWEHIAHVGTKYGEPMAAWLPVSVDGMMITGVIMAADARAAGRPIGPWARAATWTGGVLSIAAQIESGRERGIVAAGIATVFSLTLIITVEALFWRGKAKQVAEKVQAVEAAPVPVPMPPAPISPVVPLFSAAPISPAPVRRFSRPRDGQLVSPLTGKTLQLNGKRNALAAEGSDDGEDE